MMLSMQKCARMAERVEELYMKENEDLFHEGVSYVQLLEMCWIPSFLGTKDSEEVVVVDR